MQALGSTNVDIQKLTVLDITTFIKIIFPVYERGLAAHILNFQMRLSKSDLNSDILNFLCIRERPK